MDRIKIIQTIGQDYLVPNIENGEFSYPKALKAIGKSIDPSLVFSKDGTIHQYLDLRFVKDKISILIETKTNFDSESPEAIYNQLQAYVNYEQVLTGNKIIAILANTQDDRLKVWWGSNLTIDESHQIKNQYGLKSFDEYANVYTNTKNDREEVLKNTYALNELLHKHGIKEEIRSQFVGSCLLALKNGLIYENLTSAQIRSGLEDTIEKLLGHDPSKDQKLKILKDKVLESQDVKDLSSTDFEVIIKDIDNKILPFINDRSTMGQDLLNLFFTTFNKYVGKADKNQAFTPDHIVHFMCQVVGINRHSKVLDPCCGSGAFLVRAMTEAMDDCANDKERAEIKKHNIYGIEYEETAFGLATTNMLIHGDGNSNIKKGSCFELTEEFIENIGINVVLMNPPYNAQRKHCDSKYVKNWKTNQKEDPSKGFHYVHHIASLVKTGKLAVLLPMQCAIADSGEIKSFKEKMLKDHTLDAVFSLPSDVFHPGASASACCMVFNLGTRHEKAIHDTFFGYFKDDGFVKKKNLGRVEKTKSGTTEGMWADIESKWLDLYRKRESVAGLSITKKVTAEDEWLAEAYMETDYSTLTDDDFEKIIRDFVAFRITANLKPNGRMGEKLSLRKNNLNERKWAYFRVDNLFSVAGTKSIIKEDVELFGTGDYPYVVTSAENNGIQGLYNYYTEEGEVLTIDSATVGSCFYQPLKFSASDHVEKLTPKFSMNVYNALFIQSIINMEQYRYGYGRKFAQKRIKNTKIMLPIDSQGEPDWQFMEDYIISLPYSANL